MSFKELRIMAGMSLKQFGDYFAMPYRTIQNLEADVGKCPQIPA